MSAIKYNVDQWIEENKKFFIPPVCNKLMHSEGQLKVFYVGGPNSRNDYHIEEGEELFYMLKGDMCLKVLEHGKFRDVIIKEGEIFLLPGRIPHSPQRAKDTIGLVIERERHLEEKDCLRYYVKGENEILFERWFHCTDLGNDLVPIINAFKATEQFKTGKPGPGSIITKAAFEPDKERNLEDPFVLKDRVEKLKDKLTEQNCRIRLFENYATDVYLVGPGALTECINDAEVFLWQLEGFSEVNCDGKKYKLGKNDSLLVRKAKRYELVNKEGGYAISVCMPPAIKDN